MKIKHHDQVLLQDQRTGELKLTSACEDWDGGRFLCTSRGTLDLQLQRHVDVALKLAVLGLLVPLKP